ncbi:MAG: V-type ATP synthase subunit D [Candidatus Omnitrophota bacterium]
MILQVNPNRMELLRLRRRILIAKRGHKLLRDKQEELIRWFMRLMREWYSLRDNVEVTVSQAFKELLTARAKTPDYILEIFTSFSKGDLLIDAKQRRVLSVPVSEFSIAQIPDPIAYNFIRPNEPLNKGLSLLKEALPKLVKLAQLESAIVRLAEEIQRTRRRVNALEYILIPSLLDTIRFITMKLSEYERANIARLMRVKEIVRAH